MSKLGRYQCETEGCSFSTDDRGQQKNHAAIIGHMGWRDSHYTESALDVCTHLPDNPLRVLWIPPALSVKIQFAWLGAGRSDDMLRSMQRMVEGPLQIVPKAAMRYSLPTLHCGCDSVMIVNEEGNLSPNRANPRASYYYPGIVGNALIVGQGVLRKINDPDDTEMTFISLSEDYGLQLIKASS